MDIKLEDRRRPEKNQHDNKTNLNVREQSIVKRSNRQKNNKSPGRRIVVRGISSR